MAHTARPSVSVLVSSFNYAPYVAEAVDAALAQSETPLQVIVVDDGSSDGSPALLRDRYGGDPRVTLVEQANGGQLRAWITGFAQAQGDVIALLDSDDAWEPDYLRRIVDVYAARGNVDFVYGNMRFVGNREGLMESAKRDRDLGLSVLLGAYMHRWQGTATSAITLRRTLMARLLALPDAMIEEWTSRPDDCLVFGSEILGAHKIYLAEPLVRHRQHGANAKDSYRKASLTAARYLMRSERMLEHYRRAAGVTPRWLRMAKAEFRTKPAPDFAEFRAYSWLLFRAPMPLSKRVEHWFGMLAHYLKNMRGT